MKYRKLGRTGLRVSRLILGTMQMGWIVSEEDSFKLLDTALDAGITTFDTADIYSKWGDGSYAGRSEEVIGKWLQDRGVRDQVVIATKVRGDTSDDPNDVGLSRKHIIEESGRSLQRLKSDYIDLYWSHWPDEDVTQEETLRAYSKLIDEGLVHYIGASNHTAAELVESLWIADRYGLPRYEALQPPYSLARRRDYEKYIEPVIKKHDFGVTSYSPLGGGFLTGKYSDEGKLPDSKRAETIKTRYFKERNFRIVETLKEMADTHDASVVQIAIAWVLTRESITAPIIGANSVEQLNENLGASEITLSEDDLTQLNEVSDWKELDYIAR